MSEHRIPSEDEQRRLRDKSAQYQSGPGGSISGQVVIDAVAWAMAEKARADTAEQQLYGPLVDAEDEWSPQIAAAFPTVSGEHDAYATALKMVGNRHSKGAIVALVNWMLVQSNRAVCAWCAHEGPKTPEAMVDHAMSCEKRVDALSVYAEENTELRALVQRGAELIEQAEDMERVAVEVAVTKERLACSMIVAAWLAPGSIFRDGAFREALQDICNEITARGLKPVDAPPSPPAAP